MKSASLSALSETAKTLDCWLPMETLDIVSILASINGRLYSFTVDTSEEIVVKTRFLNLNTQG